MAFLSLGLQFSVKDEFIRLNTKAQHAEDENESFFMPMHKASKNVCKNV